MSSYYRSIGHFTIMRRLGRGGMGDVLLAEDTKKKQKVALKLIPLDADGRSQEAIDAERRGAVLQSRLYGIDDRLAEVYDYGDLEDHFYISMEYVEGKDLSAIIRQGALAPERAASIARDICDTLSRAHSFRANVEGVEIEGIVHGDIKPQNVRIDTRDRVRLLDFGIAKALSLSRRLTRNEFGSVGYASPERLADGLVDQHSDLWSVGVLLYEMLAGSQPFSASTTRKLEQLIMSHQPPPPLPASCPKALCNVVEKALSPDIKDRYRSASEMKRALDAFLAGGRVEDMLPEPDKAEGETRRTTKANGSEKVKDARPVLLRPTADPMPPVEPPSPRPRTPARPNKPLWRPYVPFALGVAAVVMLGWAAMRYFPGGPLKINFERVAVGTTIKADDVVNALAFSPDGKTLAVGTADGKISLWDAAGARGATLSKNDGPSDAVTALAFSPDGKRLAAGMEGTNIVLWDVRGGGKPRNLKGHTAAVNSVAFSPDGKTLASGAEDRTVKVWDITSLDGRPQKSFPFTSPVKAVAFSPPDGATLAEGSQDGKVRLWDVAGWNLKPEISLKSAVAALAFSPDGKRLAAGTDANVVIWGAPDWNVQTTLNGRWGRINGVSFSPAGDAVLGVTEGRYLVIWDALSKGEPPRRVLGNHTAPVRCLAVSPGGDLIATGDASKTVLLWSNK